MSGRLRQSTWLGVLTACAGLLSGCVERHFVVNSDPQMAVVFVNGQPLSASPADGEFVYYGTYHFTLVKQGFQTLQVDQKIPAPWYEYPGLDFIAENLVPFWIHDRREFWYHLEPMQIPNSGQLLGDAQGLRERGQVLQPLRPPPPPEPQPVPAPAPAVALPGNP